MKNVLNVLYESDDNYALVSGTSIVSLLENNKHLDELHIYYLGYKISSKNRQRLDSMVKKYNNATLYFIDARPYNDAFKLLGVRSWRNIYITWMKLLAFGDLRINTDRLLFINGHTIINGPLDELLTIDFEDNILALSYDCLVNGHKKTLGLKPTDGYYNCGVMLVNHKKWIEEGTNDKVKNHLSKHNDYVIVDQDFCNVFFKDSIKTISATYNFSSAYYGYNLKRLLRVSGLDATNFYSYDELMADYYSPKIIHSLFGIKGKPWEEGNEHPHRYLWSKYIAMTPWRELPKPQAHRTLSWRLYDLLPSVLFMQLYKFEVTRKYGRS